MGKSEVEAITIVLVQPIRVLIELGRRNRRHLTPFVSESSELRYCLPSGHGGVRECGGAATTGSDDGSIPPCADSYKPGLGLAG